MAYFSGTPVFEHVYGEGDGIIWLDDLQCSGVEPEIGDCDHNCWGCTDCHHYEDVAVICGEGRRDYE